MRTTTGIELGPDSCVIVAARPGRAAADVSAVHIVQPADWPAHDVAVTATLHGIRRKKRLPRRAAVVVWGLPEDALPDEPSTRAAVRPVVAAGFKVATVMTPAQALAALATARFRAGNGTAAAPVVWLALNTYGAAIAIVRGGDLLFSRTFGWSYHPGDGGSNVQLLQRYSLVAHLAPEVRRGIVHVESTHGLSVGAAVTCGDLPELRSLTMPLIEELDLEVETLDSMDGLRPVGRARAARFSEAAPAIRLAVAVAVARPPASGAAFPPLLRTAAAIAAVVGLGWAAVRFWPQVSSEAPTRQTAQYRAPVAPRGDPAPDVRDAGARPQSEPETPVPTTSQPSAKPAPPAQPTPAPQPAPPVVMPPAAKQVPPVKPVPEAEPGQPVRRPVTRPSPRPRRVERPPAPLKEALPVIDSILIDATRRLAIIDGVILGPGDPVGPRVIVRIEQEAVVLREPSGLDVRVPLHRQEYDVAKQLR